MSEEMQAPDAGMTAGKIPAFVQVALEHKLLLGSGLVLGLLAGFLAYMKLGPTYQATARILVSKRNAAPLKTQPQDEASAAVGERAEHVALIMSPMIVGEAVKKHNLADLPTMKGVKDVVDEVLDSLKVKRTAGTDRSLINVLDISFESPSSKDAIVVVKAVVEAYKDYLDNSHKEYTAEMMSLIDDANRDLLNQLKNKEQAYIEFRKQAPLQWRNAPGTEGNTSDTTNIHQERVIAIDMERRNTLVKQTEVRSKIQMIQLARESGETPEMLELLVRRLQYLDGSAAAFQAPLARAEDRRMLGSMESRMLPLILAEKKLLRDYGPAHPDVKQARKDIETTREFYRRQGFELPDFDSTAEKFVLPKDKELKAIDQVPAYLSTLKQQIKELEFREIELAGIFSNEMRLAKDFSKYQLEDRKLIGELKRLQTLWDTVVSRLNQVNLTKEREIGGYSMKVMAPASSTMVMKRKVKFIGGGAAAGALLSFAIGFLLLWKDTTFRSVGDLQKALGMTVLGRVPTIDFSSVEAAARDSDLSPSLYYFHKPGSPEAEAYRSIRTALFVSTHSSGDKVIQVTSPEPQDGKTTFIANLAAAIAQSGKRVLLIDADMRCPKQHQLFHLRPDVGLSDVLNGDIEMLNAVQSSAVPKLSVMTAGPAPANPAELLNGASMQRLLKEARDEFDFVLVDTPPLLAVSDPCVIAPHTDGLVLVVRMNKNRHDEVRRARETLLTHGIKVLGVVANGVEVTDRRDGNYGYHATGDYFRGAPAQPPVRVPLEV
jgi:capsular exopolysaccharide synthesis family protein